MNDETLVLVDAIVTDLEGRIEYTYRGTLDNPGIKRKYEQEMRPIKELKKQLGWE